ncbi:hypothetical protein [Micromonospora sp. NPDC023737]|uniref:hypothetical protein n=1 Tax=unclassified Micromonospora TaxID=2617518 RepID=UPI00340CDD96
MTQSTAACKPAYMLVDGIGRRAFGVRVSLQYQWRDGAYQHRLGDPRGAVSRQVPVDLAAAGGVVEQ